MKKALLVVSLITITSFVACKKDKPASKDKYDGKPLHEYIHRYWTTTSENKTYYNESNQQLYSEDIAGGIVYNISDTTIRRTTPAPESNTTWGTYLLSTSNDQDIITTSFDNQSEAYQIVSIDDSSMVWHQEKANQTFTQDNQQKLAAKEVHEIHFHCPCVPH